MANKEIKIAIIVGVIMITACIVILLVNKSNNKVEEINLEVYQSYQTESAREYIRCKITTDELIKINKEYNKIVKLKSENKKVGASITGTYMVRSGNDYIAFDAKENNYVYVNANGTQAIFDYESTLYDLVAGTCGIK